MSEQEDLQAAIENMHHSLIERMESIVGLLSSNTSIYEPGRQWIVDVNQLRRLVPEYAMPSWIEQVCGDFGTQLQNEGNAVRRFARFVSLNASEIKKPILVGEAASLHLEQLFAEQSDRFKLDDIFENLVSRLSELIAADVIDNRLVHDSLKRLNALFRRTKNGSLSTVLLTMNFGRFVMNSFGGVLKANKYAKPIIENFEAEFTEATEIVQKAEEETKREMVSRLINSQRMELFLESNPDLGETVSGYLPAPHKENE